MYFTFLFLLSFVSFQRIGVIKAHWNNFRISIEVYLLSGVHSVLLGFTVVFFLAVLMFYSNLSEDSAIQNHCCLICTRTGDEHWFFCVLSAQELEKGAPSTAIMTFCYFIYFALMVLSSFCLITALLKVRKYGPVVDCCCRIHGTNGRHGRELLFYAEL